MDTSHNPGGTPGAPPPYETRDANPRSLLTFGGVMVVTLVVAWGVSLLVYSYFGRKDDLGPRPTPFEQTRAVPPLPQLQVQPVDDLVEFRGAQEKELDSYGWVDRGRGTVHIPIERAMELLLQRGLPARPAATASGSRAAGTPAGNGQGSGH